MLRNYFRAIYSDDGVLKDISNDLQAGGAGLAQLFTPDEDFLYIGQQMPFNNVFAWLSTLSTADAKLKVEYWSVSEWVEVVDQLDGTNGFKKTGCIQFVPDKQKVWQQVYDTSIEKSDFDLKTFQIYDLYWIRISSDTELSATTAFDRFTYAFCLSSDLKVHMPDIDSYLDTWETGKTDWIEQIIAASEQVVIDLKTKGLIVHPGQILLLDDVSFATQMKTLVNISIPLGPRFEDQRIEWLKEYRSALSIKRFTVDVNRTGAIERGEFALSAGELER